jgi:hypothetical protein
MTMQDDDVRFRSRADGPRSSRATFSHTEARGPVIDQEGREIPADALRRSGAFQFDFATANPFGNLSREQRLQRLEMIAKLLDIAFIVPGTKIRYGVDGIIGLIPVVGDIIAAALSLWVVRGAGAGRALAPHRSHARQCRRAGRGRRGAGRRRRLRRAVPRQHAQRAAAAPLA